MPHRLVFRLPPPPKVLGWKALVVGFGVFVAAFALREALNYVLVDGVTFITFFPGVAVAAYLAGTSAALVVLVGAILASLLPPYEGGDFFAVRGLFVVFGATILLTVAALREAIFRLAEQDARLRLVNNELMHRNRNLFAVVTALASQTLSSAGVSGPIAATLRSRIMALARAQDLISVDEQRGISLKRLIMRVLEPIAPDTSRLLIEGDTLGVPGGRISGFALVLHELGTNALKYGAWSNASGRVTVRWQRIPSGILLEWREQGGPAVSAPESSGLGSILIEKAIPLAEVERRFEPSGLTILVRAPIEEDEDIEQTERPGRT